MSSKPIKKLYYSISEISELTGLKQYVLRYWETEFSELRPQKNRAGNRIYKEKDIKQINKIKELLYNKKYTIEGARKIIKEENKKSKDSQINLEFNAEKRKKEIEEIREEIKNIIDLI